VYCPGLAGFQVLEEYVRLLLTYSRLPLGYELRVQLGPVARSPEGLWWPYTIPNQDLVIPWLRTFASRVVAWLPQAQPGSLLRAPVPGDAVEITVKMVRRFADPGQRCIRYSAATRSTDTRLFFEVGDAEGTARTEWGRKLRGKLFRGQCGPEQAGFLRVLVLNFAKADTGWPDFICWESFESRFRETIRCLVNGQRPYDLVLPARLGLECCFGKGVWLTDDIMERGARFVGHAALDRPCLPPPNVSRNDWN
jgi:hypothetical protein